MPLSHSGTETHHEALQRRPNRLASGVHTLSHWCAENGGRDVPVEQGQHVQVCVCKMRAEREERGLKMVGGDVPVEQGQHVQVCVWDGKERESVCVTERERKCF